MIKFSAVISYLFVRWFKLRSCYYSAKNATNFILSISYHFVIIVFRTNLYYIIVVVVIIVRVKFSPNPRDPIYRLYQHSRCPITAVVFYFSSIRYSSTCISDFITVDSRIIAIEN